MDIRLWAISLARGHRKPSGLRNEASPPQGCTGFELKALTSTVGVLQSRQMDSNPSETVNQSLPFSQPANSLALAFRAAPLGLEHISHYRKTLLLNESLLENFTGALSPRDPDVSLIVTILGRLGAYPRNEH